MSTARREPDRPRRLVTGKRAEEDAAELALRPQTLDEFVGQKQVRENLKIFIAAARARGEALDHVLFHGPPGLGKTTLAQIVAREMGVSFRATSGPVIQQGRRPRRASSPTSSRTTCCSSTRSTASTRRSRRSSIRRWRTTSST